MPISRRDFCTTLGSAGLATLALGSVAAQPAGRRLRVIAYNIYGGVGWPSDRPLAKEAVAQGQMPRRLAMELALHQPDIINFSESPSQKFTEEVAKYLGMHHARFPSGGSWPGTLLSRFPLSGVENVPLGTDRPKDLFTRHWGRAMVEVDGSEPLLVHSAHLHPADDPAIRLQEIRAMLETMRPDLDARRSMLLIGDLNHRPDTEEYRLWADAGWIDTFAKVGRGEGLTFTSDTPYKRIDYVWAAGPIAERIVEARPLLEGSFRLNTADDQGFSLSDHVPQLAEFGPRP